MCWLGRQVRQFHRAIGLPQSDHIQSCVDRRPAQETFLILQHSSVRVPAKQAQKDRLRYIFGIGGIACDPVRRAKDQAIMRPKDSIEFDRDCDFSFLCQCALQGTPPVARFHN